MERDVAKWDALFDAYKRDNPGTTFGNFYADWVLAKIRDGKPVNALGPKLRDRKTGEKREFGTAGITIYKSYAKRFGIEPHHKLVDYGCGSFMTGVHFIRALDAGNYFGLDVTPHFMEMGKDMIGRAVLGAKCPRSAVIGEQSLAAAVAFQADFVISNAVAYHVHPEDMDYYLNNLRRLCAKPGCTLVLDAMISRSPFRYKLSGWSWPLADFVQRLEPLVFLGAQGKKKVIEEKTMQTDERTYAFLPFRRM